VIQKQHYANFVQNSGSKEKNYLLDIKIFEYDMKS
jgi:hypothetical protein